MKQKLLAQLLFLGLGFSLIACSKDETAKTDTSVQATKADEVASAPTTMTVHIQPLAGKQVKGNYADTTFIVEDVDKKKYLSGKVECLGQKDYSLSCNTTQSFTSLKHGFYRIILKSSAQKGLICDIFEYNKGSPINLTMNEDTAGDCILVQMTRDTGLSEAEIRQRVKHAMNQDEASDEYDLEATLFDLYMYYGYNHPHLETWGQVVNLIQSNGQLPAKTASDIEASEAVASPPQ